MIKGMQDGCLDMLNIPGKGDISKEPYDEIVQLCQRSYKESSRNMSMKHNAYTKILKSSNSGQTWTEIENMLKNFKVDIMRSFSSHFDVLQAKYKYN